MATASITHRYADGSETEIVVDCEESFADSIAQVCHEAHRLHLQICTDTPPGDSWTHITIGTDT